MNGTEFKAIRLKYGWPQGTLKKILGLQANSLIAAWENHERDIPDYIALTMTLLDASASARMLAEKRAKLRPAGRPKSIKTP